MFAANSAFFTVSSNSGGRRTSVRVPGFAPGQFTAAAVSMFKLYTSGPEKTSNKGLDPPMKSTRIYKKVQHAVCSEKERRSPERK